MAATGSNKTVNTSVQKKTGLHNAVTRRSLVIFLLGLSSGLPYFLVFGTLSVWLTQAGIERSTIGFLSWAGLAYAFKFIWAPLVDNLSLPFLSHKLGRRRGWMILSQVLVAISLLWMALWNPAQGTLHLVLLAGGTVLLAFASATQDIVIDAYRIDAATNEQQALMGGLTVAGYRLGMILSGAGVFEIVGFFGVEGIYEYSAWSLAYRLMAVAMLIGIVTTLMVSEPPSHRAGHAAPATGRLLLHFLFVVASFAGAFISLGQVKATLSLPDSHLISFLYEMVRMVTALGVALLIGQRLCRVGLLASQEFQRVYISPFSEFFGRYGKLAIWLLLVICFYRTSDIVMGVMAKVFYVESGYSTKEIGRITFAFGIFVTLAGGIIGGLLTLRWGIIPMLILGAVSSAASNLVFIGLAVQAEPSVTFLAVAITADNFSGGLATAVGVAFLSSLTSKQFSATQYAAFVSVTLLLPSLIAGYSGGMINALGYPGFFALTAFMGVPVLVLILIIRRPYNLHIQNKTS